MQRKPLADAPRPCRTWALPRVFPRVILATAEAYPSRPLGPGRLFVQLHPLVEDLGIVANPVDVVFMQVRRVCAQGLPCGCA